MASSNMDNAGSLSRWLQPISAGGWANIQRPVRQGFEVMVSSAEALAMESTMSREHLKSLEARIVEMEDVLSWRFESNAHSTGEEIEALRSSLGATPGLPQVQSIASNTCREIMSVFTEEIRRLDDRLEEVRALTKDAVKVARQASADPQAFHTRKEAATCADLVQLKKQVDRKTDRDALENAVATKVSWSDLEGLLQEKADASVVKELGANFVSTAAALDRVELSLEGTVGMEEVQSLIEKQTAAVERRLIVKAKEEREVAEGGSASFITRPELPELVRRILHDIRDGTNVDDEDGFSLPSLHQIQAEIASSRKSILRAMDEKLLHSNKARQQDLLVQEDRLRLELKSSTGRMCGRIEGLERALEQVKNGAAPTYGAPVVVGSLSQEEAVMLIRSELKRMGLSDKISRDEASAQAEKCASRALLIASKAADATQLQLRDLSDRLERSTKTGISKEELQRLHATQASLELRLSSSLSLGRWIWRGLRGIDAFARYSPADEAKPIDPDTRSGPSPRSSDSRRAHEAVRADPGSIWVPWDLEAANASPDYLQWKPGGTTITATVPGLYLLSCGFFSRLPFMATVYLNGEPLFSFLSRRERTATSPKSVCSDTPSRHEAMATTIGSPSLHGTERVLLGNKARVPSSTKVAVSPVNGGQTSQGLALTDIESSTAPHGDMTTTLDSYPEAPGGHPVESLQLHETALRNTVDRHPTGKVVASSIREYLAWPAGGVLSVGLAIPANDLKEEEARKSGGNVATTGRGQKSGDTHVKADTAVSVGSLRHSQGFLEFHKL